MACVRLSSPADIPAQRELWALAFGDPDTYIDNFYRTYYRPERVLVLEEAGAVRAMTAWFDTTFVLPDQGEYRAAYLYAVATHPDWRGRGLAGQLLAGADDYFRSVGIPAVTTVPARPDLHKFFGANGFHECFQLSQRTVTPGELPAGGAPSLGPASPEEYRTLREGLLAGTAHIDYPVDALDYQAGCCRLSGGGLFGGETAEGPLCLCAERGGDGLVVVKELLGSPAAQKLALGQLPRLVSAETWLIRGPADPQDPSPWAFAMLKWLDREMERDWNWERTGYLGLAFD